jgi:hypothetical protein
MIASPFSKPPASNPANGEIRDTQRQLSDARDDQIARVVAVVDAMADRSGADHLIASLRPRLRRIRPRRPLAFGRLLFLPLTPLILPGAQWRRGTLAVPRTAFTPLIRQLREALGAEAGAIDAQIAGHGFDETAIIEQLGQRLWSAAARIFASAPVPSYWRDESGLNEADYLALVRPIAHLLACAATVEALARGSLAGASAPEEALRALLLAAAKAGGQTLGMSVVVLLANLPRAQRLLPLAADIAASVTDPVVKTAVERAMDFTFDSLDRMVTTITGQEDGIQAATEEITRAVETLSRLEERVGPHRTDRRVRIDDLRRRLDGTCRGCFDAMLVERVLLPLQSLPADAGDAEVAGLEAAARDLRRFEQASRQAGSGELYDRQLRQAGRLLQTPALQNSAMTLADRARLMELLLGPEEALALLRQA